MIDTEGSVMVDGDTPEITEESQNEHVNNQDESNKGVDSESKSGESTEEVKTEEKTSTEDKTEDEGEKGEDKRTEKGTKLADDPIQAANQLRANAEAKVKNMEAFLSDPKKMKAYLQELETEDGKEKVEEDSIDPDKLETVDDLKKFAKQLEAKSLRQIDEVKKQVGGMAEGERVRSTANRIGSEITSVQEKYPELKEFLADGTKNPEYNEELDSEIGQFYNDLDLDKRTGIYRGQYSIAKITERFMKVRGIGEKSGSKMAQTIVKDKRTGRVITNQAGGSDSQPDEEKQSASQTIAARMRRAASRNR